MPANQITIQQINQPINLKSSLPNTDGTIDRTAPYHLCVTHTHTHANRHPLLLGTLYKGHLHPPTHQYPIPTCTPPCYTGRILCSWVIVFIPLDLQMSFWFYSVLYIICRGLEENTVQYSTVWDAEQDRSCWFILVWFVSWLSHQYTH